MRTILGECMIGMDKKTRQMSGDFQKPFVVRKVSF